MKFMVGVLFIYILSACSTTPLIDHHSHIYSPKANQWLENALKSKKKLPPLTSKELLKAGAQKSVVLSGAYFFETNKEVQDENNWVSSQVALHPKKLIGFLSVNPLHENALEEISRGVNQLGLKGLKLHLANSNFDLRDKMHLKKLSFVLNRANELQIPVLVHLRTQRKDFGTRDAQEFIKLLNSTPNLLVHVAHMGGWGGFDPATDSSVGAFIEEFKLNPDLRGRVYFDLSAVVRSLRPNENDWWDGKRYEKLALRIREIGIDRILYGSDWPEWTPDDYLKSIIKELPLTPSEIDQIVANRAPWTN